MPEGLPKYLLHRYPSVSLYLTTGLYQFTGPGPCLDSIAGVQHNLKTLKLFWTSSKPKKLIKLTEIRSDSSLQVLKLKSLEETSSPARLLNLNPNHQLPRLRRLQICNKVILADQVSMFSSYIQWDHLRQLSLTNQHLSELLPIFSARVDGLDSLELRASRTEQPSRSIAATKGFLCCVRGLATFICYDLPFDILETLSQHHQGSLRHLQFSFTRYGDWIRRTLEPGIKDYIFPQSIDDEVHHLHGNLDRIVDWFPELESLGIDVPRQQDSVSAP